MSVTLHLYPRTVELKRFLTAFRGICRKKGFAPQEIRLPDGASIRLPADKGGEVRIGGDRLWLKVGIPADIESFFHPRRDCDEFVRLKSTGELIPVVELSAGLAADHMYSELVICDEDGMGDIGAALTSRQSDLFQRLLRTLSEVANGGAVAGSEGIWYACSGDGNFPQINPTKNPLGEDCAIDEVVQSLAEAISAIESPE